MGCRSLHRCSLLQFLKGRSKFKLGFVKTNDIIPAYSKKLQLHGTFSSFLLHLCVFNCRALGFYAACLTGKNLAGNNLSSLASKNSKIYEEIIGPCKSSLKTAFNLYVAVI